LTLARQSARIRAYGREQRKTGRRGSKMPGKKKRNGWSWWYLLLLVQFVAALWVPFYNTAEPSFIGMPFFYWYQLMWILLGAGLTAIVYFATE
jgi:hypothetical protein